MKITNNQENILEIALQLFSEKGYDAVGIQQIVDMAEITKPTLYHYFGNKKGLLEAILKKYYGELLVKLHEHSDYHGDLIKTLTSIVNEYFQYCQQNQAFFYLQLSLTFTPSANEAQQTIAPYQQKLNDLLVDIFVKSVVQHGNLQGHQDILASSLTGILNHHTLGILNGSIKRTDDFVYKLVKQYMYGIYVL